NKNNLDAISNDVSTINNNLNLSYDTNDLKSKASTLATSLSNNSINSSDLTTLVNGINTYLDNNSKINQSLQQLNNNSKLITNGISTVNDSSKELSSNGEVIASSLNKLSSNTNKLLQGSSELNSKNSEIKQASNLFLKSSNTIEDGVSQVNDGFDTYLQGLATLTSSTNEFSNKITSSLKSMNGFKTTNKTTSMIVDPDKTVHTSYSNVSGYGHALAPYFLSLTLFMGALIYNITIPTRKKLTENITPWQFYLSRISLAGLSALLMAIIECTIMIMIGLHVDHVLEFYLVACTTALGFMYLVMLLIFALDNVGRFIALILMVLQLGASGGTFPIELTSKIYQDINPYIPMTYTIKAFRQTISSGFSTNTVISSIVIMITIGVICAMLLYFVIKYVFKRKHQVLKTN
ncbi:MAG: YhgE/Pip family protein, partial [Bacilli bacterium]|nr:YhgE/Pip family protein [Bacilli bacterium]